MVPVEKWRPLARGFLIRLVSFTGKQHYVADMGVTDRAGDRGGTIQLYAVPAVSSFANAVNDFAGDGLRILAARVIAGDDHAIGEPAGDAPHLRPLAPITLTTAAEKAHQFAAADDRGTQRRQYLLQRIGCMGIIDDNQWRTISADALHASGRRLNARNESECLLECDAADQQNPEYTEQIGSVERANQSGLDLAFAPRGLDVECKSRGR